MSGAGRDLYKAIWLVVYRHLPLGVTVRRWWVKRLMADHRKLAVNKFDRWYDPWLDQHKMTLKEQFVVRGALLGFREVRKSVRDSVYCRLYRDSKQYVMHRQSNGKWVCAYIDDVAHVYRCGHSSPHCKCMSKEELVGHVATRDWFDP